MPSLDFSHAAPWLQWVVGAIAVLAFIGTGFGLIKGIPAGWRVLSTFVTTMNSLADLPDELAKQRRFRSRTTQTLAAQDRKIDTIHHEVNYNNGSSVKDALGRVEKEQKAQTELIAGLTESVAKLRDEIHPQKEEETDD
ncbi:hypothetical protein ACFRFH_12175 [Leifsonia sp. NPDC056824]|uniref:hypothetical protein n=1 Tax=Leifsonia sp. NPDC056824 TaxID=3345953 RepID=UPI00367653B6